MERLQAKPAAVEDGRAVPGALLIVLAGALLGMLAFRLVALRYNATDLFFDEAQYWAWSLEPAFGYYSKPPLIAWLIGAATAICGASEFCIRSPAPVLHTLTALVVFLIGRQLYGAVAGVWAALAFATLPGISVSAGIISTDVPLLLSWALALWGLIGLLQSRSWWPVVPLATGIGLGLNAKYAMAFFFLCLLVYAATTPSARALVLHDRRLHAGLAIGALLIAPNLAWNLSNGFATFAHTADNARWGGSLLNPGKGLEFLAAQFGVFGPILFAALGCIVWRGWKDGLREPERLLTSFTVPVIVVITAQAFLSRAHANWAATAYVAGAVLVTGLLRGGDYKRWLSSSLALHVFFALGLALAVSQAGTFRLPGIGDPFARTLGWSAVAAQTRNALEAARRSGRPFQAVIADDRSLTAELLYYMRGEPTPVLAWRHPGQPPHDHFELTRPYRAGRDPVLLVSIRRDADAITRRFALVMSLGERRVAAGAGEERAFRLFSLSGYQPN